MINLIALLNWITLLVITYKEIFDSILPPDWVLILALLSSSAGWTLLAIEYLERKG